MVKSIFFLALLSLLFVITLAEVPAVVEEDAEDLDLTNEADRYRPRPPPKCPCKCLTGYAKKVPKATCFLKLFKHCHLSVCYKTVHYRQVKGLTCCDHYAPPTKSATPSPSPAPKCPCYCTSKYAAKKDCKHVYNPYCTVVECPSKPYSGYGKRPRPEFQCCYKPKY